MGFIYKYRFKYDIQQFVLCIRHYIVKHAFWIYPIKSQVSNNGELMIETTLSR